MKKEEKLIEEIREKYGSVSKMIAKVKNKVSSLKQYGGCAGMDGGKVLEEALREIPDDYHKIYHRYAYTNAIP